MLDQLTWTPWVELDGAGRNRTLPAEPGIYRVRQRGVEGLVYLGQTGRSLRERLGALAGCLDSVMPLRDPHTAAPALWALRLSTGAVFEASAAVFRGSGQLREGIEAALLALYRQEWRRSPAANFGRMPVGFSMPSGNSQRLVKSGRLRAGGMTTQELQSHLPGTPPASSLDADVSGPRWSGHSWSAWEPAASAAVLGREAVGLYRLREPGGLTLLYIGEGKVRARIRNHLAAAAAVRRGRGTIFAACPWMEVSFVVGSWHKAARLELETDLIGAHMLAKGAPPAAQFLG